jgi:hypothetical protein
MPSDGVKYPYVVSERPLDRRIWCRCAPTPERIRNAGASRVNYEEELRFSGTDSKARPQDAAERRKPRPIRSPVER